MKLKSNNINLGNQEREANTTQISSIADLCGTARSRRSILSKLTLKNDSQTTRGACEPQRLTSFADGGKCNLLVARITPASTTIPVRMPDSRISAGTGSADQ
jgi:hypothetical protein